ncbi:MULTISPECIES: phosphoribosylformylglycinamidine cyclo-ligase [Gimesia]|jgi:phosphoribosylformylglycinamidine cyclo-ligase|uniref:Phosphoribosylformylglycinamidine cyclo-ligase n=2 Tax=Gimesia TaxID=1649453 RepID=A0A6I6ABA8_9PLAN|nr:MULTISPECIES: phosphoribosylformylglycinamidine cyclo-ligase [Gimesia]MBN67693.1 phosphoribosylformylglycinamidine cyclo-ligase [Gimesia sp.]QDT18779.1 Phosphoribosylformylglycinamidine cyclo-ligase [Gimesia chilikensis]QDT82899.1 Phosphoribosylformylglycinamidine cyclo-ligase [Gimesia chilikensis]QGQ23276.1 phosphoribosylformylglycinamidine cyclo-ligase [Gimesia benthica]
MAKATYKDAGVDLDLYQKAMSSITPLLAKTHVAQKSRVMELPGGFAGLFRLNNPQPGPAGRQYEDPVLVSGTDGVGTKIKVAIQAGIYNTIGIDLVAMCVNDCLCLGAEPLFFLDYIALGKDDPERLVELMEGVTKGCVLSKAALLGGETAIMPDLYGDGDFDMAGFCVGVVERNQVLDGQAIQSGDVVLGLESSGFHSNGYSLIRKVVFEMAGLDVNDQIEELNQRTVASILLEPTRIYADAINTIFQSFPDKIVISGLAHITGGGLVENVERILPQNRRIDLKRSAWEVPAVFDWLQSLGDIDEAEMFRVFNMGIGLVAIVRAQHAEAVQEKLQSLQIPSHVLGKVTQGDKEVTLS